MPAMILLEGDRAYERILSLVTSGQLSSDNPLSERKLAESLDMSRTPIREAIKRLTREGVLEVRPAKGTYVRQLTEEDIREIYEARIGLEGAAAELAAQRGPTDRFEEFKTSFEDMIATPENFDLVEVHQLGQEFHVEIFHAARNKLLLELYEPLRVKYSAALRMPRVYNQDWVFKSVNEHLAILNSIQARDAALARKLITSHLGHGLDVRTRILQDLMKRHEDEVA